MSVSKIRFIALVAWVLLFCSMSPTQSQALKSGIWRGVFTINTDEVPFQLEIARKDSGYVAVSINGDRRDQFDIRSLGNDSLLISLNTFESALFARIVSPTSVIGEYRTLEQGADGRRFPFRLEYDKSYRFIAPENAMPPKADLSGRWVLKMLNGKEAVDRVAVFEQKGDQLKGIILSVTGDTRELQGEVQGDRFFLSGFTGTSPVLVTGTILAGRSIRGEIGTTTKIPFEALRNDDAALPDAYSLTYLKPGRERLRLSLPDLNGGMVSLEDEKYKGKVLIIEILGSWCPNCIDQIEFLSPWFKANQHRGVAVIGVAFEAKDDIEYAKKTLSRLKNRYDIQYELLFAGKADNKVVAEKFDDLNTFLAFPTTIIIGRDGKVREIHTGFSGKGTGFFYEEYVKKFNRDLDHLISEQVR